MGFLNRIFYGKNGFDVLNRAILILGAALLLCSALFDVVALAFCFLLCLLAVLWRALSPDLKARRRENNLFLHALNPIAAFFKLHTRIIREAGTHRYLKCPKCGLRLRVPRGKGRISVKCSRCGIDFIRRV